MVEKSSLFDLQEHLVPVVFPLSHRSPASAAYGRARYLVEGAVDTFYAKDGGPLGIWRQWAPHAQGQAMKGGHFFPEENPYDTAALVPKFLAV